MRNPNILLLLALTLAAAGSAFCAENPAKSPLADSGQLVLVVSENDSTPRAILTAFERSGGQWVLVFSCPAVVGTHGMGWGRGLQRADDSDPSEPVKREGDGKSPMGVYPLVRAWGYLPADSVRTSFPYERTTSSLICVDEARSEHYAMVLDRGQVSASVDSLPSHEDMLRRDDLYKYVILIGYNTPNAVPGAGSCIFLHVWRGEKSSTSGCTAVGEENIVRMLGWLDPLKNPLISDLTRKSYLRLKDAWGLP
jgi:L,D-peptidoglycan transpeptidase YkuD (ErfK/YbiS/YcfS/YnhG family)